MTSYSNKDNFHQLDNNLNNSDYNKFYDNFYRNRSRSPLHSKKNRAINQYTKYNNYSERKFERSRSPINHNRSYNYHKYTCHHSREHNYNSNSSRDTYLHNSIETKSYRSDSVPNNTLAVFSLDRRTTEQDLYNLYSEYGCKKCQIITDKNTNISRGFGFVNFCRVEDALRAKNKTNGKILYNRRIRVDFSYADRANSKFDSDGSSSLSSSQTSTRSSYSQRNCESCSIKQSCNNKKCQYNYDFRKNERKNSETERTGLNRPYYRELDAFRFRHNLAKRGPRTPSISPPSSHNTRNNRNHYCNSYEHYSIEIDYKDYKKKKGPRTPSTSPPPLRSPSQDLSKCENERLFCTSIDQEDYIELDTSSIKSRFSENFDFKNDLSNKKNNTFKYIRSLSLSK